MAEKLGLDGEVHELKLGRSFDTGSGSGPVGYHSIRYDFKPASVDTSKMACVDVGEGNSISVNVPHIEGSGTSHTVYKGNKRPCQKECVLIIDHKTGEFTLEKLATNIQLKKTRDGNPGEFSEDTNGRGEQDEEAGELTHLRTASVLPRKSVGNAGEKYPDDSVGTRRKLKTVHGACSDLDLLGFARGIRSEIGQFLEFHTMENSRKPYVTSSCSIQYFRRAHPLSYCKAKRRLQLADCLLDDLSCYLCQTFPQCLVGTADPYGHVQRLEDTVDFIINKFYASL